MAGLVTARPVFHSVLNDRLQLIASPTIPEGAKVSVGADTGRPDSDGAWTLPQEIVDRLEANGTLVDPEVQRQQAEAMALATARAYVDRLPEHLRDHVAASLSAGGDPDEAKRLTDELAKAQAEAETKDRRIAELERTAEANADAATAAAAQSKTQK